MKRFREKILGGRLLKPDQVEPWIMERERIPKPPAGMRLTIEAPESIGLSFDSDGLRLAKPISVQKIIGSTWDHLDYATPEARHVKSIATPAVTGPLAQLRQLSEDLAKSYAWQDAQATLFVLTGLVPVLPSFRWSITPSAGHAMPEGKYGARRISLDVDLILSPKELAARYAEIRRRLRPEKSRRRELSEKHLTLAYFLADHGDALPWAKRLQAWNTEYPRWKYGHESNFRRDALRATERILSPAVEAGAIARALWAADDSSPKPKRTTRIKRKRGPR